MKKFFIVLGLLGLLAQPAHAQQYSTGTPVVRPSSVTGGAAAIPACPMPTGYATPIQSVTTCCPLYTGGAAGVAPKQIQSKPVKSKPIKSKVPVRGYW